MRGLGTLLENGGLVGVVLFAGEGILKRKTKWGIDAASDCLILQVNFIPTFTHGHELWAKRNNEIAYISD